MKKSQKTNTYKLGRLAAHNLVSVMCVALIGLSGSASAAPITNGGSAILNAGNGSVQVSGNGITSGCIDWYNTGLAPASCQPNGTTGSFSVEGSSSAPFLVGQTGTIQDLNFSPPLPLVDFITIALGGGLTAHFDLTGLRFNGPTSIGDCTAANGPDGLNNMSPGATCTAANSPFQITNGLAGPGGIVNTVTISLTIDLWGYTGSSGTNYNAANRYVGIFTTQGAVTGGNNIASIEATIGGGGAVSAAWSATLAPVATPSVPEPGSYLLAGLGLLSVASLLRRRTR